MFSRLNFYGWTFGLTIAFPIFLASLGVAGLTFDLVSRVSTGANIEDRERTRQIVKSALNAVKSQLANTATDNSHWDDAVRKLYGTLDEAWVTENYGVPGVNYDVMMVIDREIPEALAAFHRGQAFQSVKQTYFRGKIEPLLDLLPKDNKTHGSKATIMNTVEGLAVVAAAPILPISEDLVLPAAKPRYMILLKYLTPSFVGALGSQYVIQDLAMVAAGTKDQTGEIFKDFTGAPVAVIQWTDRRPGDIARAAVSPKAFFILGFLALVMAGITFFCWRLIRTIGERAAVARHEALHDSLTGLPNRAALSAEINRLALLGEETVAVAFADLDGFKEVNDTYDHETGDRLIQAVAVGLSALAANRGLVCRLGGDEFVMLVSGKDAQEQACRLARDFISHLGVSFDLQGRMASVGASIGIASTVGGAVDAQELMRRADIAMYKAKASGKNCYWVFDAELDAERNDILDVAGELRQIILDGSIEIAYQPVVDAVTKAVVSVEALARWPSSSPRRIAPDQFIRIAETCGLIDDLGNAILAKACTAAANWPGLRLALNISPVQLRHPDFVSRTLRTIADNGMSCHNMELEITEGVLLDDVAKAQRIFGELRAAGLQIALDDFGSGFSSIGYLRQFKFDRIKIDRSLIDQILLGARQQNVVQGTMLLAAGLSTLVTAEGVEFADQVNILQLSGCTELQGYYFYKPMPAEEITRLLLAKSNSDISAAA